MKKTFIAVALAMTSLTMSAQVEEFGIFDHVGVGIETGSTGLGFEVSAPVTDRFQVRAGFNFFPVSKVKDLKLDISGNKGEWNDIKTKVGEFQALGINDSRINEFAQKYLNSDLPNTVNIDGKFNLNNFKVLVDFFPFKKGTFRITTGFYIGKSQIIEAYTTNCESQLAAISYYNQNLAGQTLTHGSNSYTFGDKIGAKLGDYLVEPNGNQAMAYIKVNGFKPYLGIGFGRAVPKKTRLAFAMDLGVQFWGTPKIYVQQPNGDVQIKEDGNVSGKGGIVKTASQITIYPCLSFRLNGRIL